jgi:hypothetical protein
LSVIPETNEPEVSPLPRPPCAETVTLATTWPITTSPPKSVMPFTSTDAVAEARPASVDAFAFAEIGPVATPAPEKLPTYWTASGGALISAVPAPPARTPQARALAVGAAALPSALPAPAGAVDAPASTEQARAIAAASGRFVTATHYGVVRLDPSLRVFLNVRIVLM